MPPIESFVAPVTATRNGKLSSRRLVRPHSWRKTLARVRWAPFRLLRASECCFVLAFVDSLRLVERSLLRWPMDGSSLRHCHLARRSTGPAGYGAASSVSWCAAGRLASSLAVMAEPTSTSASNTGVGFGEPIALWFCPVAGQVSAMPTRLPNDCQAGHLFPIFCCAAPIELPIEGVAPLEDKRQNEVQARLRTRSGQGVSRA